MSLYCFAVALRGQPRFRYGLLRWIPWNILYEEQLSALFHTIKPPILRDTENASADCD